jgi:RNA polymerase sigma-70 factor (ECF subfamily)
VRAARCGRDGPYQLQAAIAAAHDVARDFASTNWRGIAALYERLNELDPSPVIELNRAVAVTMSEGVAAGLAIVDSVAADGQLEEYYALHAARADLLRRLDDGAAAAAAYDRAIGLARNAAERRFLERRRAALDKAT